MRNDCGCGGTGWIVPDLPLGAPGYGRAVRCGCNTGVAEFCGLNEQERELSAEDIAEITPGGRDMVAVLRHLVHFITANPSGWLTLWGEYGTAKTLTAQAIVAQLVKAGRSARFYHARQLESGWFSDVRGDTANAELYRRLPILAIDEIDKINTTNEWVRHGLQELLDTRYRGGVAGTQLTILICQVDPAIAMPGDILSRMSDGRFARPWAGPRNPHVVASEGALWVPGIVKVVGKDARPLQASAYPPAVQRGAAHRAPVGVR